MANKPSCFYIDSGGMVEIWLPLNRPVYGDAYHVVMTADAPESLFPDIDLVTMMKAALTVAFDNFREQRADETLYGFGVMMSFEAINFTPIFFTEQALDRVVKQAQEDTSYPYSYGHLSAHDQRSIYRWWVSCFTDYSVTAGNAVGEILEDVMMQGSGLSDPLMEAREEARVSEVQAAAIDALQAFDQAGELVAERDAVVLSVWEFDEDDDDRMRWAMKFNPPEITDRYQAELALPHSAALRTPISDAVWADAHTGFGDPDLENQ